MSPRKAKTAARSGNTTVAQPKPQAKLIRDVSTGLEQAVTRWASSGKRDPRLVAAVQSLSAEIISLGHQDSGMLLDQPAIRTARQRVATTLGDNYRHEDVDRAASIFSSSIMKALA